MGLRLLDDPGKDATDSPISFLRVNKKLFVLFIYFVNLHIFKAPKCMPISIVCLRASLPVQIYHSVSDLVQIRIVRFNIESCDFSRISK